MARPFNPKAIKERIAGNKRVMKSTKKEVTEYMNTATKGEAIDAATTRTALAVFIKAAFNVISDTEKLNSIED